MHVVLLNQPFYPDVVATAQMGKDLADHLVSRGHRVSAVCSRSIYGKTGAVLPGRETIDGIEVHRVGANVFGKRGIASRLADFLLFYVLAFWKVMTISRPDVVVSYTTPPFIALVGLAAKHLRGSRAVYWVMDLYPDVPVACGVMRERALLTRFFEGLNRLCLKRSDAVVVLGRCMRDRVLAKGVPPAKVGFIPVWAVEAGLAPVDPASNPCRAEWGVRDGETVVMYSGNFGIGHDSATILGAIERLAAPDGGVPPPGNGPAGPLRFEFVGGGKKRAEVEAFIREKGLRKAAWREYAPIERLGASLSAGDIHLISMRPGMEGIIVPSKLFGVMAVGRPAIFIGSPVSEIARVLTESGSGLVVEPGDVDGLVRAIVGLAADPARRAEMGRRARGAVAGRYDKAGACRAWEELLVGLAGEG